MENPSSKQVKKPHAIIVALPLQGHINPTIQLAIKLASNSFSITFINAQHIHQKITQSNSITKSHNNSSNNSSTSNNNNNNSNNISSSNNNNNSNSSTSNNNNNNNKNNNSNNNISSSNNNNNNSNSSTSNNNNNNNKNNNSNNNISSSNNNNSNNTNNTSNNTSNNSSNNNSNNNNCNNNNKNSNNNNSNNNNSGSNNNNNNNININIFNDTNLDIEYMTVSDGLPVEYDRSSNLERWAETFTHCYPAHVELAVAKVVRDRGSGNVGCLIADGYSSWASNMANKYGLLYVSFWTEAAIVLDVYFHMHLLMENGHLGSGARDDNNKINYIPGVESIKQSDLMSFLQDNDLTTKDHQRLFACIQDAKRADFILCNTVHELEFGPISAIQAQIPFYAIGPLISNKSPISTSLWAESDCTRWLNAKPPKSVLYVSFGSFVHLSKKDVVEIAEGIKLSGLDFLWALRPDTVSSDDVDPLPVGFRDEVLGRGMVVGWTNQKEVLSHCAIGGFLTHCGWNSVLESMWCGVPMLCFPLHNDQFTDRKLVVDDWKIGCNLYDTKIVTREEVCEKIRILMSDTIGSQFNDNIKEVKQIMCEAVAPGGSSHKNLDAFIKDIKTKISLL